MGLPPAPPLPSPGTRLATLTGLGWLAELQEGAGLRCSQGVGDTVTGSPQIPQAAFPVKATAACGETQQGGQAMMNAPAPPPPSRVPEHARPASAVPRPGSPVPCPSIAICPSETASERAALSALRTKPGTESRPVCTRSGRLIGVSPRSPQLGPHGPASASSHRGSPSRGPWVKQCVALNVRRCRRCHRGSAPAPCPCRAVPGGLWVRGLPLARTPPRQGTLPLCHHSIWAASARLTSV